MSDTDLRRAAQFLSNARHVVVVSGAGISAESKIPTFRDAMTGLWASFDPQKLATPEAFDADPSTVTRWYDFRRMKCAEALPNPGHTALARLETLLNPHNGSVTILTQNVDGLHQRAGSRNVVELHGSIMTWRCTRTGREFHDLPAPFPDYPPKSPDGGLLRPAVVWFGEMLPPAALDAADKALRECDLFFSIGTSALVHPVAGFAGIASARNIPVIEINRDPTPLTPRADICLRGPSGELLPALLHAAFP